MHDLSRLPKFVPALKLAKAGVKIFPVKPNSKEPAIKGWQTEATSDPDKVGAWWKENPDYNIGIHTIDRLVVDLDVKGGGPEAWRDLLESRQIIDDKEPPLDTMAVRTPTGGFHLHFSLKPDTQVSNSVRKLGPGIDTRGKGGYVLGPGSSIDGKFYELISGKKKAMYAPDWLIARSGAPKTRTELSGVRLNEETENSVAAMWEYIRDVAPEATEGDGGDAVTHQVAKRIFDFGVSKDTAREGLLEWNETKAHPPWEMDELEAKLEGGLKYRQRPPGVDNPDLGDAAAAGFDLPSDAEINASAVKEGVPARVQLAALTPPDRKSWKLVTFAQACEFALTLTNDPLVADVIYAGQTSVTFGESGASKSFIMLDMAFHVATGMPWHGKPTVQGPVIWLAAEGGFGVYKRIRALAKHYGVDPETVPLYVLQRPVDLLHEDRQEVAGFVKLIQETQKEIGTHIALIIIDTLNRVMAGGNENGPEDMGHLLDNFERIKAAVGSKLHLNIIHHTGLTLGRARGHTSLKAAADTEIEVAKPGRFTVKKQRDEREGFKLEYSLRGLDDLGTDIKGNKVGSAVVVSRVTEAMDEIAEATDGGRVLRALDNKLRERSEEHDIPETAAFNKTFLLNAFVAAGLTRRKGEPRTLEGYQDRKSGDRVEFYNLLKEFKEGGVILVCEKDQYSRIVKP